MAPDRRGSTIADHDRGPSRSSQGLANGSGLSALLADDHRLYVPVEGHAFPLDARTGRELGKNLLTGFGVGIACLATARATTAGASGAAAERAAKRAAATQ